MNTENSRNTVIFIVCAVALLILYEVLVMQPAAKRRQAEQQARVAAEKSTAAAPAGSPAAGAAPANRPAAVAVPRNAVLSAAPRVSIDTPALRGSISLRGARLDDLYLKQYRETLAADAPPVELLRPEGAQFAYFAELGWTGANVPGLPGADTLWTLTAGDVLGVNRPVTLTYQAPGGLTFTRTVAVDERYMFTVTDRVTNGSGASVTVAPYGSVQRRGVPTDLGRNQIIHEGAIGVLGDRLKQLKYKKWRESEPLEVTSTGGWLGVTDKYWLTAIAPAQNEAVRASFRTTPVGDSVAYETNFVGPAATLQPGGVDTQVTHVFAGAKTVPVLRAYEKALGLPRFDQAVDWGNFWFLTRPIFTVLEVFFHFFKNFGLAILALTVLVKLLTFPLANKSYESMTKMKKVQPQMEELRKRHKDDPAKQQQELMALYAREKINPLMGCLPMLIPIPIFYALYKTLSVTIEMRHAPFFGWIQDLSSRDPTTVFTLFGLIPWDPATAPLIGGLLSGPLHIGVWPLIMGFTMWLQQAMSPPAGVDPIQARIFQLFPIIFTFTLAPFAAGLVIYWSWNNLLSIAQQYVIMHKYKVENPIDSFLARIRGSKAAAGA